MVLLHPSVRIPLLILGVLSVFVGIAALAAALFGGAGALLWRGALAVAIGGGALWLARRARPVRPPASG